jgi:hypothetical protein
MGILLRIVPCTLFTGSNPNKLDLAIRPLRNAASSWAKTRGAFREQAADQPLSYP